MSFMLVEVGSTETELTSLASGATGIQVWAVASACDADVDRNFLMLIGTVDVACQGEADVIMILL